MEAGRRHAMHLLTLAGNARNHTAQAEESLAALEREAERLDAEMRQAGIELEDLGVQKGQSTLRFESAVDALKRLEAEIAFTRESLQARRLQENTQRAQANWFSCAVNRPPQPGAAVPLKCWTVRNHGYSTDTVRRLLKPGALGAGRSAIGTLADFLEVSGEHEAVVDEFLREELNYIVVESWVAAEEGVRLLKSGTDGRATFLVHSPEQRALFAEEPIETISGPGLTPLKDAIRVLNGFGRTLESILPKLGDGYLSSRTPRRAQRLAAHHIHAFFLTPGGECFHNTTVTGGNPAKEGPLALKRELRETEARLAKLAKSLADADAEIAANTRAIEELAAQLETRSTERRKAETDTANQGAALKQMEAEAQRIERRLQEWASQAARNKDAREAKSATIAQKQEETQRLEAERSAAEAALDQSQAQLDQLRQKREGLQQEAAVVTAELAGLEERRRGAEAGFPAHRSASIPTSSAAC